MAVEVNCNDSDQNRLTEYLIIPIISLIRCGTEVVLSHWHLMHRSESGAYDRVAFAYHIANTTTPCWTSSASRPVIEHFAEMLDQLADRFPVEELGGGVYKQEEPEFNFNDDEEADDRFSGDTDDIFSDGFAATSDTANSSEIDAEWDDWVKDASEGESSTLATTQVEKKATYVVHPPTDKKIRVDGAVKATFMRRGKHFDVELWI